MHIHNKKKELDTKTNDDRKISEENRNYSSFTQLLYEDSKLRYDFITSSIGFLTVKVAYWVLLMKVDLFGENIYLLTNIFFVAEIMGYSLSGYISKNADIKQTYKICLLLSAVFLTLANFFYNVEYIKYILYFFSTLLVSFSYNQFFIFSPIVFDLNVRGTAASYNRVLGNLINILTSQIFSYLNNGFLFLSTFYMITYYLSEGSNEASKNKIVVDKAKED